MTPTDLPPDDWDSERESFDEYKRCGDVERRLRSVRPRTVSMDSADWDRIIAEASVPEDSEQPPVRLPQRGSRTRGAARVIGTTAASWLCGAIVGAGAMFLAMNQAETQALVANGRTSAAPLQPPRAHPPVPLVRAHSPDPLTRSHDNGSEQTVAADVDVKSRPWPESSILEYAALLSPLTPAAWKTRDPGGALYLALPPETLLPRDSMQQTELQRELARSFIPPPGATPWRILQDLNTDFESRRPL